jgi:RNA polymerase sigma-70 factor (ECF subfamily)
MDTASALDECLRRLAAGDLSARDRMVELCAGRLRAIAHRMLGGFPAVRGEVDTDDVFQNAALRLHRALGDLAAAGETPRSILGLAATQVRRELLDLARRCRGPESRAANRGTNALPDRSGRLLVEDAAGAPEPLDRWEEFHLAIAGLPSDEREVVHLAWYLGADQSTIASVLGCSTRTVKSRWRAARGLIAAALDGQPPD